MSQAAPIGFPAGSFIMVSNLGALVPVAANPVIFGTTDMVSGTQITYAAGIFSLAPGHRYLFQGGANTGTFSGATGLAAFRWRDITNAALLGVQGLQSAPTNVAHVGQSGVATAVSNPTAAPITVQLEAITLTAFTSIANAWATVQVVG